MPNNQINSSPHYLEVTLVVSAISYGLLKELSYKPVQIFIRRCSDRVTAKAQHILHTLLNSVARANFLRDGHEYDKQRKHHDAKGAQLLE